MSNIADTATTILSLLEDNIGKGTIKQYFDGIPVTLPQSYLPAIAVAKVKNQIRTGATGIDELTESFRINVIVSEMMTMGKSQIEQSSHKILKQLVEGLDTDGLYVTTTILGLLRTHFILSTYDGIRICDQQIDVDYDVFEGRIREGVLTEEANITFTTKKLIKVEDRNK
jgi:hypothetical protein